MKLKIKKIVLSLVFFFCSLHVTYAATFSISNSKSVVNVNDVFTATLIVDTGGVAINSADGVIGFSNDLLTIESVNKVGSIFSLWVTDPSFSNTEGTLSFGGGLPTPGYIGSSGKILQIQFRAKKTGVASLSFVNANIFANDGLGTNVLKQKNGSVVTISSNPIVENIALPALPKVFSKEIVDSDKWYSVKNATFAWDLPSGVNAVQLLRGSYPDSIPTVTYVPAIKERTLTDLEDGVWYLHVRFRDVNGWGPVAHKKMKIDNTVPVGLEVTSQTRETGEVVIEAFASDTLSGIHSYELFVDGVSKERKEIKNQKEKVSFVVSSLGVGEHLFEVKVFDVAQNTISKEIEINVGVPQIEVSVAKTNLESGESLQITGKATPNATVNIIIENEKGFKKISSVVVDENGRFEMVTKDIVSGQSTVYAELKKEEKDSFVSNKVFVSMVVPSQFFSFDFNVIKKSLSTIIPIVSMIFTLLWVIIFGMKKILHLSRRTSVVKKENKNDSEEVKFKTALTNLKTYSKSGALILNELKATYRITEKDIKAMNELSESIEALEGYFSKKIHFKK